MMSASEKLKDRLGFKNIVNKLLNLISRSNQQEEKKAKFAVQATASFFMPCTSNVTLAKHCG